MNFNNFTKTNSLKESAFKSLSLLNRAQRSKLTILIIVQILNSILDTIGILLLGVITSLGMSINSEEIPNNLVASISRFLSIDKVSMEQQLTIYGIAAMFILTTRTLVSLSLTKYTFKFLSNVAAEVSKSLLMVNFRDNFSWVRSQRKQEIAFALTEGINYLVIGVLSTVAILLSDIALFVFTLGALLVINTSMALLTTFIFLSLALFTIKKINKKLTYMSAWKTQSAIQGSTQIIELMNSIREVQTGNRLDFFSQKFFLNRLDSATAYGTQSWLQQLPKAFVEITIVLGGFLLTVFSLITSDSSTAIPSLIIFLAASMRVAPTALRMQQSIIAIKSFSASSVDSLNYVLPEVDLIPKNIFDALKVSDSSGIEDITVDRVTFGYPDSEENVLKDLSIKLTKGQICAIVGPSGSGKSTFCDLLLGLLEPKNGTITISGVQLREYTHVNSERIAYLPQDVFLIEGSIGENILLGRERNEHTEKQLKDSVKIAGITEFIESLPNGLDTQVGGGALALSGGQKQRIGLARTLYSKPSVLIMDEPTSSLDAASENIVTETLNSIKKDVIIVIVAHRLSTIRDVDRIIYLKEGVILGDGNFEMLKKNSTHFEKDAELQGL